MATDNLISIQEAAKLLRVKPKTIRNSISAARNGKPAGWLGALVDSVVYHNGRPFLDAEGLKEFALRNGYTTKPRLIEGAPDRLAKLAYALAEVSKELSFLSNLLEAEMRGDHDG